MLKHVVFFKFKDGVGEEEIVGLEKSLAALPPAIPEIFSYFIQGSSIHATLPKAPRSPDCVKKG
jgi:hypothetical protein